MLCLKKNQNKTSSMKWPLMENLLSTNYNKYCGTAVPPTEMTVDKSMLLTVIHVALFFFLTENSVSINSGRPSFATVKYGLPQGSILGLCNFVLIVLYTVNYCYYYHYMI